MRSWDRSVSAVTTRQTGLTVTLSCLMSGSQHDTGLAFLQCPSFFLAFYVGIVLNPIPATA